MSGMKKELENCLNVDRTEQFPKYPKIKIIGDEENKDLLASDEDLIYIEEKMDGANTRFFITNGRVIVGSRNVQITTDEGELQNERWKKAYDFVLDKLAKKDLKKYDGYILFGEAMMRHTLDYWDKIPPVLFFDVLDTKRGRFLDYNKKCEVFKDLDLPVVPLVKILKAGELKNIKIDDGFVPQSKWRDGKAEGVVIKNYNKQIFAKYVRSEFKEVNRMAFGGSKKYAKDDSEKIVYTYCTNARIEKKVFEMIDEGWNLDMKIMKELPIRVWKDIVEENGKEILLSNGNSVIDFKKVRNWIAKRCVNVLKQIIANSRW